MQQHLLSVDDAPGRPWSCATSSIGPVATFKPSEQCAGCLRSRHPPPDSTSRTRRKGRIPLATWQGVRGAGTEEEEERLCETCHGNFRAFEERLGKTGEDLTGEILRLPELEQTHHLRRATETFVNTKRQAGPCLCCGADRTKNNAWRVFLRLPQAEDRQIRLCGPCAEWQSDSDFEALLLHLAPIGSTVLQYAQPVARLVRRFAEHAEPTSRSFNTSSSRKRPNSGQEHRSRPISPALPVGVPATPSRRGGWICWR